MARRSAARAPRAAGAVATMALRQSPSRVPAWPPALWLGFGFFLALLVRWRRGARHEERHVRNSSVRVPDHLHGRVFAAYNGM